ncbi:MAG: hypothetical protein HY677_07175, partial [Chloroflexi bacterium]|nr:hypothetical protein [Chloroflexota bacterium]
AEATAGDLAAAARRDLSDPTLYSFSANNLLKRGLWHPQRDINLLRTQVWPALYAMLALQEGDPIRIWGLRKEEAIALLPEDTTMGRSYRRFHEALLDYYPAETSVEAALRIIQRGVLALRHVKEWWEGFSGQERL